MLNFFVPAIEDEDEPEEPGGQAQIEERKWSEEIDSLVDHAVKVIMIDTQEIPLAIYDYPSYCLFELECLLDYFIKTSEEIEPTAAGYICTILESLFNDNSTVVEMFRRFFSKEKYLERLFRHLDLTSVTNFLSHGLLGINKDRNPDGNLSYQTIYYRVYLAYRLSRKLLEAEEIDVVDNLTTTMKRLINTRSDVLDSGFIIRVVILGANFFSDLVKRACKSVV